MFQNPHDVQEIPSLSKETQTNWIEEDVLLLEGSPPVLMSKETQTVSIEDDVLLLEGSPQVVLFSKETQTVSIEDDASPAVLDIKVLVSSGTQTQRIEDDEDEVVIMRSKKTQTDFPEANLDTQPATDNQQPKPELTTALKANPCKRKGKDEGEKEQSLKRSKTETGESGGHKACHICNKTPVNLSRHYQQVHKYSVADYKVQSQNLKAINPLRECSFIGCHWLGTRFDRHFKTIHFLDKEKEPVRYRSMITKCKSVRPSVSPASASPAVSPSGSAKVVAALGKGEKVEIIPPPTSQPPPAPRGRPEKHLEVITTVADSEPKEEEDPVPEQSKPPPKSRTNLPIEVNAVVENQPKKKPSEVLFADIIGQKEFNDSMKLFKEHTMSPDGGLKAERIADQRVQQVTKIAETVCGGRPKSLVEPWVNKAKVWANFFEPMMAQDREYSEARDNKGMPRGLKPSTLYAYSLSLEYYLKFILETELMESITVGSSTALERLANAQEMWRTSMREPRRLQENESRDRDSVHLLSLDDMVQVMQTKFSTDAAARLRYMHRKNSEGHKVDVEIAECKLLRNYIVTRLTLDNGGRAGNLSNLTCKMLEKAFYSADSDVYTIRVNRHKTATTSGSALVQMYPDVYNQLIAYYKVIRPRMIADQSGDSLFVQSTGEPLTSNKVTRWMSSFIIHTNHFKKTVQISPTSFRKMWVDVVCETGDPEARRKLAVKMCHSPVTQGRWYQSKGKEKDATDAFKMMAKEQEKRKKDSQPKTHEPMKTKKSTKSTRENWSMQDEATLEKVFKLMLSSTQRPRKMEIRRHYAKNCREIWCRHDTEDWKTRCTEKIRSMWKSRND